MSPPLPLLPWSFSSVFCHCVRCQTSCQPRPLAPWLPRWRQNNVLKVLKKVLLSVTRVSLRLPWALLGRLGALLNCFRGLVGDSKAQNIGKTRRKSRGASRGAALVPRGGLLPLPSSPGAFPQCFAIVLDMCQTSCQPRPLAPWLPRWHQNSPGLWPRACQILDIVLLYILVFSIF